MASLCCTYGSENPSVKPLVAVGQSQMPFNHKVAALGGIIDLPLGRRDKTWSADHIDTMTLSIQIHLMQKSLCFASVCPMSRARILSCGTLPVVPRFAASMKPLIPEGRLGPNHASSSINTEGCRPALRHARSTVGRPFKRGALPACRNKAPPHRIMQRPDL